MLSSRAVPERELCLRACSDKTTDRSTTRIHRFQSQRAKNPKKSGLPAIPRQAPPCGNSTAPGMEDCPS